MLRDNGDLFIVTPRKDQDAFKTQFDRETRLLHEVVQLPPEDGQRHAEGLSMLRLGKVQELIAHEWGDDSDQITALEGLGQALEDQLAAGRLLNPTSDPVPFDTMPHSKHRPIKWGRG